ncbi:MAG: ABC transporter permease [Tissierellia bacterium]|nr:ABC transporter permease [Tissierellia bacterium]
MFSSAGVYIASLETGLILSILAMGVVITYKILDIADLSVEGTFPLGAFVFAALAVKGANPFIATAISLVIGAIAGFVTFLLYKKLKVAAILSGILTMTMLYSVNLRLTGRSNVPLFNSPSIFSELENINRVVVLILIVIMAKLILDYFFKTEKGYLLIVTGDNESLVKSLGKNPDRYTCIGLMISNGMVALSGSLMAQYQGFSDAQMGATMIVTALASIIIGDTFLKNNRKLKNTSRAIIGAIAYKLMAGLAIELGLEPGDLKGITALIVIGFIAYNNATIFGMDKIKRSGLLNKEGNNA